MENRMRHKGFVIGGLLVLLLAGGTLIFYSGSNSDSKPSRIEILQEGAASGDAEKQLKLGIEYTATGDMQKAVHWLRESADQGNAKARYLLSLVYREEGLEKESFGYAKQAAEQGIIDAQYCVAVFYKDGFGTTTNATDAVFWMKKAAECGHSQAQFQLAIMYWAGMGVAADEERALYWGEKAASGGYAPAKNWLLDWMPVDLNSLDNLVYLVCEGTIVVGQMHDLAEPFFEEFALDTATGRFFNLNGKRLLTFTNMASDILTGVQTDNRADITYRLNRVANTFSMDAVLKDTGEIATAQGKLTVKKQGERSF